MIYQKECIICGKLFETNLKKQICCSKECSHTRNRATSDAAQALRRERLRKEQAELEAQKPKEEKSAPPKEKKLTCDAKYCSGCVYYLPLTIGQTHNRVKKADYACHYIYYTGTCRPCGLGKECTVKTADDSIVKRSRKKYREI